MAERKYFETLKGPQAAKWFLKHREELPEIQEGDKIRLMPTWFTYMESGEAFARMKYDEQTFEPKQEVPTLTRTHKTEELSELWVWDIERQKWLIFVIEAENSYEDTKLCEKYAPFETWRNWYRSRNPNISEMGWFGFFYL